MKLMILDGNSIINRAFYGVRLLSTREGIYTNGIYGFLNILEKLRAEETPDALCVAFDLKAPTFRHVQYEAYKANRHGMPEELAMQMPILKEVLTAMRIPIYETSGWEADDIIGTVGRVCGTEGWDCVIVTGDRDSLQLVDSHVTVKLVTSKAGQTLTTNYTPAIFQEEYGFEPAKMVDLKSLMGDSSDNIPGVAGIGPKTATELLCKFGSLDGIYENINSQQIKDSVRKKLEAGKEMAYLSFDLATIRCNAPISFQPEANMVQPADKQTLRELFTKLEFVKLMDRYHLYAEEVPAEKVELSLPVVTVPPKGESQYAVFVDDKWETFGIACEAGVYQGSMAEDRQYLAEILKENGEKYCLDFKNFRDKLCQEDMEFSNVRFDVALAAYVLNPSETNFKLTRLAKEYLGKELESAQAGEAAQAIFQLQRELWPRLKEEGLIELYEAIELPLCQVLSDMELEGVCVDQKALENFGQMLSDRIEDCQEKIFAYAGEEFNINSTKKLGEILFEKLGLPPVKKTKSGYSTDVEVLEKLKAKHPIISSIMDYRMLTKLKSTYADGLLKVIEEDGRIHTTFENMVTATGRLSSTNPNLQNIPVRTELGSEIRKMFVPRPGWILVDADYSQIELRVLAHIADDEHMLQAFLSGEDIHTVTASQVFGVPVTQVTPLMRRHAKAVNFGIVYGISEFSLAEDIGVTRKEAKAYIDNYLENYAGVRQYMHDIVEKAKTDGYVTTLFGRKRYLPELKSSNFNIRSFGQRVALNTPIQGTAADIIKLAMIRVAGEMKKQGLQAKLILQVHDELIVECPIEEAKTVQNLVTEQMQSVVNLKVPLIAEAKMGKNWYEAK